MSILDDAIREHLELKRAHGADESELKKLEDEAFGPPARPDELDPFAEAPTEFLAAPEDEPGERPGGRRVPNIADLQEPPPPADAGEDQGEGPAEEERPAGEQATIPVPRPESDSAAEEDEPAAEFDTGPTTEERHAIADQPTELFDVEAELETGSEQPSPTDEQLLDSQLAEPRLAPAEPLGDVRDTGPDAEVARPDFDDEDDEEFFSEQRLSDELNQALEAPVTDEHALPAHEPLSDEYEVASEEAELPSATVEEHGEEEDDEDEDEHPDDVYEPETGSHDDVLEDTPDFLEDTPGDDELWFEQKPPKDFDLDD